MGRPERPLDAEAGSLHRFAFDLRQLRHEAGGPSYRQLAKRAHYSASALSEAAGGERLPSLAVTLAYVEACGGNRDAWEARWHAVAAELTLNGHGEGQPETQKPPYLGLAAFQPDDASWFFGRDQLIAELVSRLAETPFLAVFGPSGSGKSSLLRAGLLPAVWAGRLPGSQGWPTALLTPGEHPLEELAVHLARLQRIAPGSLHADLQAGPGNLDLAIRQTLVGLSEDARLLLVVDQFEELFTLCREEDERTRFLDALLGAVARPTSRARVVLGMRADFYARCADYPTLVAVLRDAQVLVGSMTAEELRSVIVEPAARVGYAVEPALVATILGDVQGRPGALPLVSHALLETWQGRQDRTLTLTAYQAAGGVQGAIAQTAEKVYAELDPAQQRIARSIVLRLTALGEGVEDTRRRVDLAELGAAGDATRTVLERLAAARLVVVSEQTAEIAHEALIGAWPRLRQWLADNRESLRIHRQLTEAAQVWESLGHEEGALYRGARLSLAREWAEDDEHRAELNPLEQGFLEASIAQDERERAATQRHTRQLRRLVAGLAVLLVITVVFGVVAVGHRQTAVSRQLAAEATALAPSQPALAMLLSVEAFHTAPTVEARSSLLSTSAYHTPRAVLVDPEHQVVWWAAVSPDGQTIASADGDETITLWDVATRSRVAVLTGHSNAVSRVAFSSDGATLASADGDGKVVLWDVASRSPVGRLAGHTGEIGSVAFSPDGRTIATASKDQTIMLWDVASRSRVATLTAHTDGVLAVAFSPDGVTLASGGEDQAIILWDLASRAPVTRLTGHTDEIRSLAFSPDGRILASASRDSTIMLWDVVGESRSATLTGHTDFVNGIAFSPDGRMLASGSNDQTVVLWDVARHSSVATLRGHVAAVANVAFSPDGQTLVSASFDRTITLWDPLLPPFSGHTDAVMSVAFSPDGRTLASAARDRTVALWDVATGTRTRRATLTGHTDNVRSVAFSPDGRLLASAGEDQKVLLWDAVTGFPLRTLTGHENVVSAVAFSPDGQLLASGSTDRTVTLWDPVTGSHVATLTGHRDIVNTVAFSPDGQLLASGSYDGTVTLWDVASRSHLATLPAGLTNVLAFSPDGQMLASGSADQTVVLWDVATRSRLATLSGHLGGVKSVAFSPDGRMLASGSADQTVVLWDVATRSCLATLSGYHNDVNAVAFSRDGRTIASGSTDHRIIVSEVDPERRVARVCALLEQSLAQEPWVQSVPTSRYRATCG